MIYLDYNATTPVDKIVLEAMLPYFTNNFGNAASTTHLWGKRAKDAVENARNQVANLIHCTPQEITFTSGATESINLAIKGVAEAYTGKGKHIVTVKTEHRAVLDTCKSLEKQGYEITWLDVKEYGLVDLADIEAAIRADTILVSVMWVNNETGVIQPMDKIAEIVHQKGCILMSDATQAVGKLPIDLEKNRIDLLTLSAHKFYGPKGVGALYTRRKNPRVAITAQMDGGGHENGKRSGTLNVPGIVGLGEASELAKKEREENENRIKALRDKLENNLLALGDFSLNGSKENRLYNVSNICFKGVDGAKLLRSAYSWLAISSGSACSSADAEPSHVLRAMGLSEKDAKSSMRFSLGKYTTEEDVEIIIEKISRTLMELSSSNF
jgi:cysteine desulfurase